MDKRRYEVQLEQKGNQVYDFFDFCPRMFQLIRKFYGVTSEIYLQSIGPEKVFGSISLGNLQSLQS